MAALRRSFTLCAAFVLLVAGGCANLGVTDFDPPEVELLALQPMPGQGMEARFRVRLRIVNPNAVPLSIEGMAYEVFIRESRVLSGVSNQPLRVAPFSESVAELEVAAGMLGSLALLRDLMSNPTDGTLPYRLDAKLSRKGLGGSIRVSREGQIDLSARPGA